MQETRFIRESVLHAMLGLAGLGLGCSGERSATPVDEGTGKAIAADMKKARQELKVDRAHAQGPSMKESMRGQRSGRGPA